MERNVMGELNVYRGSGAKPNFSEIARRHGMDRHTVAKYWRGGGESAADGRSARGSAFDPLEEVIRAKAQLPGMTKMAVYAFLREGRGEGLPGYGAFTAWCRARDVPFGGAGDREPHPRFETPPGRQLQFDWKEGMRLVDSEGEVFEFSVFTATLGYSRKHRFIPVRSRTLDDLLSCLLATFTRLGGVPEECITDNMSCLVTVWIGYTDVDSSGRGAGDGRAVYEGPQAPEAFHRRVQEADSRPLQRRQAQARDHGRVRPRQEHRGEVDQVDKRDWLAARRVQPHARAEPDPGARAREPQAPDGGRRLKTSGADIRSKVRAIAANEGRYPISAQCRLLGVARSTYYSMRSRADRPAAPDPAAPAVVAAHAASKGRYGSRKIKASLERSGVTVSRRRVCRIMRENGLVSAYGRKRFKVHPGAVNEADVPNVVARGFGGRAPRTHICSDLTYVRVGASWNYVCLLVDLYNREIVGHSAGPRKDARLVKSAFATLSFPISDIEVFHTDRGSEFDNAEIDLMLEAFGIERSLSAKGCPYDNAVDESTNRILKAELVHRETFGTTRELRAKLSDYAHWYNNFRIHSTLGYMSPVEFREAGLSLPESSK